MYLTLTPDDNFKNSGLQRDQCEWTCSIPSGLLFQPKTQIALHSGSWKVLEGISIPTGQFTITVMGYTFQIPIAAQTFVEPPAGSGDTAGKQAADYLNTKFRNFVKNDKNWYSGLQDNSLIFPAWKRFGNTGTTSSILWEWDNNGKDFVFEMKYCADNDYDTGSTVMVSGTNAAQNFNDNAYTKVQAVDTLVSGSYRYRLKPANTKNTPAWNDSGFCAFGSAFCCDGLANGGVGKYGELVFTWSDVNNVNKGMVGFATKHFDPLKAQTQVAIVASIELDTGSVPVFRELKPDGTVAALTATTAPPVIAHQVQYRMRMEASETGDETFTYAYSTDNGATFTNIAFNTPATDRYVSNKMDSEEIMPMFKPNTPYDASNLYGVDNMTCSIVPSIENKNGGYKWEWSDYPKDVQFNPDDLSNPFDIKPSSGDSGSLRSDGGVVSNVNTFTSSVYVDIPTFGIKSITAGVERNVVGALPLGEMATGDGGMGSVYGLQFNQVYNMIYHELRNQEIREHNQVRVRLIDKDGNLLTNIDNPAINLCVKPASI
jgi:hypothetical protein